MSEVANDEGSELGVDKLWKRLGQKKALPVVFQRQIAECWLACLVMAGSYHGLNVDLPALRQRVVLSTRGGSMRDILDLAEDLGLRGRVVRADLDQIDRLVLPAILHWGFNHFVVLAKITRKGAIIHDPARGRVAVSRSDFSREYTGIALELWPSESFVVGAGSADHVTWQKILGKPRGLTAVSMQVFAVGLASQCLGLSVPLTTQWTLDNLVEGGNESWLFFPAAIIAAALILGAVFDGARSAMLQDATTSYGVRWRSSLVDHLTKLPMAWFGQRQTGVVVSDFNSTDVILRSVSDGIINTMLDGILSVVTFLLMLRYNVLLGLITLGGAGSYAAIRTIFSGILHRATSDQVEASSRESAHLVETVRCIRTIKTLGREHERHHQWLNFGIDSANAKTSLGRVRASLKTTSAATGAAEQVAVFVLGMMAVMQGSLTVGALVAFLAFRQQFYDRVSSLIDTWSDARLLRVHADRVADIVAAEIDPEHEIAATQRRLGEMNGRLECREIGFQYGSNEPFVLKGLNVILEEGECVAVTGRSGCGKSTLISLLLGLERPTEGEILMSGVSLASVGRRELRTFISAVGQDDVLFSGSIIQNITSFDVVVDVEWAMTCAQLMEMDADILRMPMGYNTVISEGGSTLSGGQRQRLCLARAIYRRPKILILDEATSNLDIETERKVSTAIKELGMTRVMIAHRPEAIKSADRVLALQDGRLLERDLELQLIDRLH